MPSGSVRLLARITDLVHTCVGMGATNSATGQGHSDHSGHLKEEPFREPLGTHDNITPLGSDEGQRQPQSCSGTSRTLEYELYGKSGFCGGLAALYMGLSSLIDFLH